MDLIPEFRGINEEFEESLGVPESLDKTNTIFSDCETLDEISSGKSFNRCFASFRLIPSVTKG